MIVATTGAIALIIVHRPNLARIERTIGGRNPVSGPMCASHLCHTVVIVVMLVFVVCVRVVSHRHRVCLANQEQDKRLVVRSDRLTHANRVLVFLIVVLAVIVVLVVLVVLVVRV